MRSTPFIVIGIAVMLAACGMGDTAESKEPPPAVFGTIAAAEKADYLVGSSPNRIELSDGTLVQWDGDGFEATGCKSNSTSSVPSVIGCPIYVWINEDGAAVRVFGAERLDPGTEGSTPFWAIPGELYRRSGDVGIMSTGRFKFGDNATAEKLRTSCGSVPWWEIDPVTGSILRFAGWGVGLADDPCAWNI